MFQSAENGAYSTLWAATAPKNGIKNGGYYKPVGKIPGPQASSSGIAEICNDETLAERLWKWTEDELEDLREL